MTPQQIKRRVMKLVYFAASEGSDWRNSLYAKRAKLSDERRAEIAAREVHKHLADHVERYESPSSGSAWAKKFKTHSMYLKGTHQEVQQKLQSAGWVDVFPDKEKGEETYIHMSHPDHPAIDLKHVEGPTTGSMLAQMMGKVAPSKREHRIELHPTIG